MAVYEKAKLNQDVFLQSFYIYGSSRIGEVDTAVNMATATVSTTSFSRVRGIRRYEMSNHLGNVMVVMSDRKVYDGNVFKADLVSTTDYYAFGMVMSDRSWNTEGYRWGFNGKENDNEVKGTGNQQDYGMRIYDGRLGRFLSVDPLTASYPWYTPYQFAGNTPIWAVDLDGLEELFVTDKFNRGTGITTRWYKLNNKATSNDAGQVQFKYSDGRAEIQAIQNGSREAAVLSELKQESKTKEIGYELKSTPIQLTPPNAEVIFEKPKENLENSTPPKPKATKPKEVVRDITLRINFETSSDKLIDKTQALKEIAKIAAMLKKDKKGSVELQPQTDGGSLNDTNLDQSQIPYRTRTSKELLKDRANAIKRLLIEAGVSPNQIITPEPTEKNVKSDKSVKAKVKTHENQ